MGSSQFNTALWGGGAAAGVVSLSGTSVIYGALRLLGVLRPGQEPNDSSKNDGLAWLNELLDSWATERLMVKRLARTGITMTGAESYAALPHRIEAAGFIDSGGVSESEVEVWAIDRWRTISDKTLVGTPSVLYPDYTVVEATLYPWPRPANGELFIYQWQPLEAFADLETVYSLPAGYALALRYCLAEQIAPAFLVIAKIPQPLLDRVYAGAREFKGKVKSLNAKAPAMIPDNPFRYQGRRFDTLTGRYE